MTDYQIETVDWLHAATQLRTIRTAVFIGEQGVSQADEWDGQDDRAWHFLVTHSSGKAIATARLLPSGQIGRMAVLAAYRRQGIGRALLSAIVNSSAAQSCPPLYLHAQTHAVGFYQQEGFVAEGPVFMDAGIPHRTMRHRGSAVFNNGNADD